MGYLRHQVPVSITFCSELGPRIFVFFFSTVSNFFFLIRISREFCSDLRGFFRFRNVEILVRIGLVGFKLFKKTYIRIRNFD